MNRRLRLLILALTACVLPALMASFASAGDKEFELSVSRNVVHVGESLQLSLKFSDTRDMPAPELKEIDGFNVRYLGPSTMMSIVNGRVSSSITHIYRLVALKKGKFTIGPLTFKHGGDTYRSGTATVEVVDRQQAAPRGESRGSGGGGSIFVELDIPKREVYINEVIPVKIKLYVGGGIQVRDIQYPEVDFDGFSAEEFSKPRQYQESKGGVIYDVVEFSTRIFGTKAGKFRIGPAGMTATMLVRRHARRPRSPFEDFFGHDPFEEFFGGFEAEPLELRSEPVELEVLPLPEEGRPGDFSGAVGDFSMSTEVSPAEVKAGDPVTIKILIKGEGNIGAVSVKGIETSDSLKVYEPTMKTGKDEKTIEQIVIPMNEDVKEIPAVSFSYFDPGSRTYRTIRQGPFPVKVKRPEKTGSVRMIGPSGEAGRETIPERLGRDIIFIKEHPGDFTRRGGHLYENGLFIAANIAALVLFAVVMIFLGRRERLLRDSAYARRLDAPRQAKRGIKEAEGFYRNNMIPEFYDTVFRTLRDYSSARFGIPAGGITEESLCALLREKGVDDDTIRKAGEILRECETARYAPAKMSAAGMSSVLVEMKQLINRLEKVKV